MAYAFGYSVGIDKDLVREDLLATGDVVNAYGLEVIERNTTAKLRFNPFKGGLYVKFKIKIKFEDGNVIKFNHKYKLALNLRLVQLDSKKQEGQEEGDLNSLLAQLQGVPADKEDSNVGKIGFKID